MSENSENNDFYGQWVGESSAAPVGDDPLHGAVAPVAPVPPGREPTGSAQADPYGQTHIVDRDQVARDLQAWRGQPDPAGAAPLDPDAGAVTNPYGADPGLHHRVEAPSVEDNAPQYSDPAVVEPGRHSLEPPPRAGETHPPHYPGGPPRREAPLDNGGYTGPLGGVRGGPVPADAGRYGGPPPGGAPRRDNSHRLHEDPYASVGAMRAQIHESQVASPYKQVPELGWRHGLWKLTRINLGVSASEKHRNDLRRRLKVNLRGKYVIAVMQSKGGVSKTTTSAILGAALAQYRDEKIVAIDANPASGNLSERVDEPSTMSWRGLNSDRNLRSYSDFREFLGKDSTSGLEVLGSDRGRTPMTGSDLATAWSILQVQYPIAIVDCGNQLNDDITRALLEYLPVDAVVVPSTTRLDGARGAASTLNWLLESGYPHLVREAVVVVSNINKVNASAEVKQLHKDFERTVGAVHDVGFDPHLSDAVAIDFNRLQPETALRYTEAAASLADGFARAAERGPSRGPADGREPRDPTGSRGPRDRDEARASGNQWPGGAAWGRGR